MVSSVLHKVSNIIVLLQRGESGTPGELAVSFEDLKELRSSLEGVVQDSLPHSKVRMSTWAGLTEQHYCLFPLRNLPPRIDRYTDCKLSPLS